MSQVSRDCSTTERVRTAVLLTLGLLVGCAVVGTQLDEEAAVAEVAFAFPHYIHVQEQGFECRICHTTWEEVDDPGMPPRDTCLLCHEQMDQTKPADRQVASLFDGEVFRAAHNVLLPEERIFPHWRHATSGLYCNDCHIDIEFNETVAELEPIRMWDCMGCHNEYGVSTDCTTCHKEIRAEIKPASHSPHWGLPEKEHCTGCHFPLQSETQYCSVCHEETVSHNTLTTAMPQQHYVGTSCRECHGNGTSFLHPDPGHDCAVCHK